ncbi:MAG: TonB-dependent receptor [Pseudomonadales bacterium]
MPRKKNLIGVALCAALNALCPTVYAQTAEAAPQLEEVIVTANRLEENLQEVAMSVSAFTAEFLKDSGLTDFTNLDQYTPSLKITPGADSRSTSIRIRGIGSAGTNTGIDPSVGFFIDGVYQGRAGMSISDLIDVARVEVLRGPQGTLYGKNTAAGAISVVTKAPSSEFEGQWEATYTNQERLELRGVVNIPLGTTGNATRLAGFVVEGDHLFENTYADGSQQQFNNASKWGLRSRTLFNIGDKGELVFTADYSNEDTDCCAFSIVDYNGLSTLNTPSTNTPSAQWAIDNAPNFVYSAFEDTEPQGSPPAADPFGDYRWLDADVYNKVDVGGLSLEWNHELANEHVLTFINAWRHYESDSGYDGDFTAYNAVVGTTTVELDQYSTELRIASPQNQKFTYQGGLYAYFSDLESNGAFNLRPALLNKLGLGFFYPEGLTNNDANKFETTSFAAFGQATWNFSDKLSATVGLRWTYEKKDRDSQQQTDGYFTGESCDFLVDLPPIAGPCIDLVESRADADISPSLQLSYFPSDNVMLYGSVSRGFKSGGFDQRRLAQGENGEFEEEIATNYELGWKGTWFDRRLLVNGTFYYTEYADFQTQAFDGSSVKVTNAGSMESHGLELETMLAVTSNLTVGAAIGYNKAEYTDFVNAQCTVGFAAEQYYSDPRNNLSPGFANPGCTADLGGQPVDNTPELTVSSYLQHSWLPTEELVFVTRLEYNFTDSYHLDQDLDPNLFSDAANIINLRFTLADAAERWEAALWVRNLLDEETYLIGLDIPTLGGFAAIPSPEQTYGVTLRHYF